jgi:hypothetical protein
MDNSGHASDSPAEVTRRREALPPAEPGSQAVPSEHERPPGERQGTPGQPGQPGGLPGEPPDLIGDSPELPGEVAELVGEISEDTRLSRRRRLPAAISVLARRSGQATRYGAYGARYGGRWLTAEVLAMAPRLPVRDRETLRAQFPSLPPEELADALIHGAARSATAVGAAAGMAMVLPLPAAPVEVAIETLALVGIEIKLVAELHEVYGMRPPGTPTERMLAYVAAWAHRRGVAVAPAGLVIAVGSPLRRRLQRRLIVRAGRSATSLGPLLTGAAAGAALNRRETRRLGNDVRDDLRRRSPHTTNWPA